MRTFKSWPLDELINQCEQSIKEAPIKTPELWAKNGKSLIANLKLFKIMRNTAYEWEKIENLYATPQKGPSSIN